jgi:HAE1 family hydrophobic/amphiphilic exporter-1
LRLFSKHPEIELYTTVNGNNLLNNTVAPNAGTFFITLKPWEEREKTALEIVSEINARCMKEISEATVIAVGPPPIIGLGNGAGFTMMLQDRAGNSPQYLAEQAQKFIAGSEPAPGNRENLYALPSQCSAEKYPDRQGKS